MCTLGRQACRLLVPRLQILRDSWSHQPIPVSVQHLGLGVYPSLTQENTLLYAAKTWHDLHLALCTEIESRSGGSRLEILKDDLITGAPQLVSES